MVSSGHNPNFDSASATEEYIILQTVKSLPSTLEKIDISNLKEWQWHKIYSS